MSSAARTLDVTVDQLHRLFSINVYSAILMTQSTIPHMPPGGRVINFSSALSKLGLGEEALYAAAKSAIDALSFCWAQEVGHIIDSQCCRDLRIEIES